MSEKYTKKLNSNPRFRDEIQRAADNKVIEFNNLPFEERKRLTWAEHRKTARDILVPVVALGALGIGVHEITGAPLHVNQSPKLEKYGDHHGSSGMPSDEHLRQFSKDHGIHFSSSVQATKVGNGPVKVSKH